MCVLLALLAACGRTETATPSAGGALAAAGGGSLRRANVDGSDVERIIEPGVTLVPKQLQSDSENGYLYWADREGAKVWGARLDGSGPRYS